jgi:hypothetical protein
LGWVMETPRYKCVTTFKFTSDSPEELSTDYRVLTELPNSRIHTFRRRFLSNIFPSIQS